MGLVLRVIVAIGAGALVLLPWPTLAVAPKRVALVIGNSDYRFAPKLRTPVNDAIDMSFALNVAGYYVVTGLDVDREEFDRKMRDFASVLQGAEAGVFLYSGHGLQVARQNYLVPVDAQLKGPSALDVEVIRLDIVQGMMTQAARTSVLFLDASRDNPLARNLARAMGTRPADVGRGLAAMESGVGALIGFSAQPDNVAADGAGRNSPYTGALLRRIGTSSDDLGTMLAAVRGDVVGETQNRQVPWDHSSLTGRVYLTQSAGQSAAHNSGRPTPEEERRLAEARQAEAARREAQAKRIEATLKAEREWFERLRQNQERRAKDAQEAEVQKSLREQEATRAEEAIETARRKAEEEVVARRREEALARSREEGREAAKVGPLPEEGARQSSRP